MAKKIKEKFLFGRNDAADIMDISPMAFDNWIRNGCPLREVAAKKKGARKVKKYYIPEIIQWRIDNQPKNKETETLQTERTRLAKAQADGQEIKNKVSKKELAPVKLLEIALSEMAVMICSRLESIPLKVKKSLPKLSAAEIEIVTREVNKALNEASKQKIDFDRAEEIYRKGN